MELQLTQDATNFVIIAHPHRAEVSNRFWAMCQPNMCKAYTAMLNHAMTGSGGG
jgi:hypothetical protein